MWRLTLGEWTLTQATATGGLDGLDRRPIVLGRRRGAKDNVHGSQFGRYFSGCVLGLILDPSALMPINREPRLKDNVHMWFKTRTLLDGHNKGGDPRPRTATHQLPRQTNNVHPNNAVLCADDALGAVCDS